MRARSLQDLRPTWRAKSTLPIPSLRPSAKRKCFRLSLAVVAVTIVAATVYIVMCGGMALSSGLSWLIQIWTGLDFSEPSVHAGKSVHKYRYDASWCIAKLLQGRVLFYYSDLTMSQSFQPMAAQLSKKAALPLAKILATASCLLLQRSDDVAIRSSHWQCSFRRKLRSHWLKFLRQRHVAEVRQDPGMLL